MNATALALSLTHTLPRNLTLAAAALVLAGCAMTTPPASVAPPAPAQWQAVAATSGPAADLRQWWSGWDDAALMQLIDAAQQASPSVSAALTRIAQARAAQVDAGAALLPVADASLAASRGNTQGGAPVTQGSAGLVVAWEIDLWGRNAANARAAGERALGAQADWHDARTAVAAEVGRQYINAIACRYSLAISDNDARSRTEVARLTRLKADAGLEAPAAAALAEGSAALGRNEATQIRARCDQDVKALVALTALQEPAVRAMLAQAMEKSPPRPPVPPLALPAAVLAQRPDVFAASRQVSAASADVGSAEAARYPTLVLSGQVGRLSLRGNATADSWSIGPLTLVAPIFDGGRRAAGAELTRVQYDDAVNRYRAVVRNAVREVEQALVAVQSADERREDARKAAQGYRAALQAAQQRQAAGLGTLLELEDVRRTTLAAELALVNLQRDERLALIDLYRAAGGGWQAGDPTPEPLAEVRQASRPALQTR